MEEAFRGVMTMARGPPFPQAGQGARNWFL